jgi:hypothetical protein
MCGGEKQEESTPYKRREGEEFRFGFHKLVHGVGEGEGILIWLFPIFLRTLRQGFLLTVEVAMGK